MSKHLGNVVDPNELVVHVGADTVRLAVLQAASPGRIFNWNEQPVRYCQIFLKKLYAYAEPRLRAGVVGERAPEIDASDKLRRRLANWCRRGASRRSPPITSAWRCSVSHTTPCSCSRVSRTSRSEPSRQRGGELQERDREAIAAALLMLVQVLAPLTPHIAEELWSLASNAGRSCSAAPWPQERVPGRCSADPYSR